MRLIYIFVMYENREESRPDEIKKLTSQGKIPAEVDLAEHPEKSLQARSCTYLYVL